MTPDTILVTGASGFVGRWLVRQLCQRNYHVRALVRQAPEPPFAGPVELIIGDLTKPETYRGALDDVAAVVHAALTSDLAQDLQASVTLYEKSTQADVRKFIHLSSIAIYGNPAEGVITEDTPPLDSVGDYPRTKRAIEDAIRTAAGAGETVILRLGCVYGPGGGWWTNGMLQLMKRGKVIAVDRGRGTANLIHVGDVGAMVLLLLARSNPPFDVFNVTDGMPIQWSRYFSELERILGHPATVSMSAAKARQHGKRWVQPSLPRRVLRKLLGTRFVHPLDEVGIEGFASHAVFSNEKAATLLGFKPVYDLRRGMQDITMPS